MAVEHLTIIFIQYDLLTLYRLAWLLERVLRQQPLQYAFYALQMQAMYSWVKNSVTCTCRIFPVGHGLPAGLAEVEMIERARAKRAW